MLVVCSCLLFSVPPGAFGCSMHDGVTVIVVVMVVVGATCPCAHLLLVWAISAAESIQVAGVCSAYAAGMRQMRTVSC